jgi:ABC-type glycerol-3-phosphate transport system permease component
VNNHPALFALRTIAAIACATLFLLPLWWVAVSAFRAEVDIFKFLSPLSLWTFFPDAPTLENMRQLFGGKFGVAIMNSIFVAATTVVVGLLICAGAAFALAVMEFPAKNAIFAVMVVSFLIPFDAIAVPLYGMMRKAELQNTYIGLILPGIGNGLAIFSLRQFFLGIPKTLREAALIDGLSWWAIFTRIYLPLSRPALVGAGLILFVFQWQAYLWPLLIAPNPQYTVASVAIAQFSTSFGVSYGPIFAGALLVSVIPMVVIVVLQRYFTASLASSGSKE